MKNTAFPIALLIGLSLWFACSDAPKPISVTIADFTARHCIHDSLCAEMRLMYPVVSGSDEAVVKRLNDSIHLAVYLAANADLDQPLQPALDAAAMALFDLMKGDYDMDSSYTMPYAVELDSRVAMKTKRHLSLEMNGYAFTGGAHGYYYTVLNTFDIGTAESVLLAEIIADTTALRPLLEQAFLDVHRKEHATIELEELLLNPDAPLDLPANYCVVPEGVQFVYNPYEVSAYAVGQTAFLLTWKQLGRLADRGKWVP